MKGLLKKVKLNARTAKIASTSMLMSIATATTCAFAGTTTTTTTGTAEGLVQNLLGYVFAIFKYIITNII